MTEAVAIAAELELKSVEGAAINEDNETYNVVIAYFNKPVSDIAAGDIQIRQVNNDQLFSVDTVSLSSDGMRATITLANSNAAGASVVGLEHLVDYNMIVKKDGSTASKVFYIPATLSNQTVYATDADKETITIGYAYTDNNGNYHVEANGDLTVPETIDVNYADLLGRTVSVKFDKDYTLTSLNVDANETVVYGAFKGSTANKNLTNMVTKESYKVQETSAGTIRPSSRIDKTAPGWMNPMEQLNDTAMDADTEGFMYGKMVLNGNKTIKVFVNDPSAVKWQAPILVTSIKDNTILAGTTEQNIKNYTILEDGIGITIDDIEEGDMVFVDTQLKLAVVYNDIETGELEAIYDGKFKFGGTTYDVAYNDDADMLDSTVYYIEDGGARKAVDNDYLNAIYDSGEDVTVYFGMNGQPVYLLGTVEETVSTTKPFIVLDNPKFYTQSLTDYLRLKGFNGEKVVTYDINLSKLDTIVDEAGKTFKKGYEPYAKGTTTPTPNADTFKGFKIGEVKIKDKDGSITQTGVTNEALNNKADIIEVNGKNDTFAAPTDNNNTDAGGNNIIKGTYLTLTFNDKDEVTGINFEDAATGLGDPLATTSAANNVFKSGLTVVNGLQCNEDTPLYFYNLDKSTVEATTLGAYTGQATTNTAVRVYSYDNKNVTAFVTTSANAGTDAAGQTVKEVVVKSSKRDTSSNTSTDTKLAELTVIYQGNEEVYTKFASGPDAVIPVAGSIYTLTINKDGETVDGLTLAPQNTTTVDIDSVDSQTFKLGASATAVGLATTVEPTIVKWDADEAAYVAGTFADIQDADKDDTSAKAITWSWLEGSTNYVDTIVVTKTAVTTAFTDAQTAISAKSGTDFACTAGAGSIAAINANSVKTLIQAALGTKVDTEVSGATVAAWSEVSAVTSGNVAKQLSDNAATGDKVTCSVTVTKDGYSQTFEVVVTLGTMS